MSWIPNTYRCWKPSVGVSLSASVPSTVASICTSASRGPIRPRSAPSRRSMCDMPPRSSRWLWIWPRPIAVIRCSSKFAGGSSYVCITHHSCVCFIFTSSVGSCPVPLRVCAALWTPPPPTWMRSWRRSSRSWMYSRRIRSNWSCCATRQTIYRMSWTSLSTITLRRSRRRSRKRKRSRSKRSRSKRSRSERRAG